MTIGERAADWVAKNLGRWAFILGQTAIIAAWMWWNAGGQNFDPYPYILLNLMLSLQAAYTGPILLISSNRADRKRDRLMHLMDKHQRETHAAIERMEKAHRRMLQHLGVNDGH